MGSPLFFEEFLNIQPNEPHQCNPIASSDGAIAQDEVELHLPILNLVLEVHVVEEMAVKLRKREIVGANQTDGRGFEQRIDDALGADKSVARVGSLQEFIEKKKESRLLVGQITETTKACDLGIKTRAALLEGVVDKNTGADA
jgi:hypothetical protein